MPIGDLFAPLKEGLLPLTKRSRTSCRSCWFCVVSSSLLREFASSISCSGFFLYASTGQSECVEGKGRLLGIAHYD